MPSVFAKYAYLAAYHNHFCDTVSHYSGFDKALRIADALASVREPFFKDKTMPPEHPVPHRPSRQRSLENRHSARLCCCQGGGRRAHLIRPSITGLRSPNLSDVLSEKTLRDLLNDKLPLCNGKPVRRVSTLTPRHEDGVVLALWTQPALAVDVEKCTMAKAIVVVTSTEDEFDAWIEKTGAVAA